MRKGLKGIDENQQMKGRITKTSDNAHSLAAYMFLRTVFASEKFSEEIIHKLGLVADGFTGKCIHPVLLRVLWKELISGSYIDVQQPDQSIQLAVSNMVKMGISDETAEFLGELFREMWNISECITKKEFQQKRYGNDPKDFINAITRMLDLLNGHAQPYYYMHIVDGTPRYRMLIHRPGHSIGYLLFSRNSIVKKIDFTDSFCAEEAPEEVREFAKKMLLKTIAFPEGTFYIPNAGHGKERLISVSDGTAMGDELIIWRTDAPKKRLRELEKQSCQVYIDGGEYDDVPVWRDVLTGEGYQFEYIDSCQHVTPFTSSDEWMKTNYRQAREHYTIDNQPNLANKAKNKGA